MPSDCSCRKTYKSTFNTLSIHKDTVKNRFQPGIFELHIQQIWIQHPLIPLEMLYIINIHKMPSGFWFCENWPCLFCVVYYVVLLANVTLRFKLKRLNRRHVYLAVVWTDWDWRPLQPFDVTTQTVLQRKQQWWRTSESFFFFKFYEKLRCQGCFILHLYSWWQPQSKNAYKSL